MTGQKISIRLTKQEKIVISLARAYADAQRAHAIIAASDSKEKIESYQNVVVASGHLIRAAELLPP